MIEFALRHIADEQEEGKTFKLSITKVKLALALIVLHSKPDGFKLSEFIEALKGQNEMMMPAGLQQPSEGEEEASFDPKQNLLECLEQFDLSLLKGYAIILPDQHLRFHEKG